VVVWKELLALFSFTQAKYGRVDLVFANAGVPETQNAFEDVYDENGDLVEPNGGDRRQSKVCCFE
jgi:NAD(P)-dependent dehydrogenase (short-subunit alcohol dehydrogenase family)